MVSIAAHSGITSRSSMPSVIRPPPVPRRLPSRACTDIRIGQVVTTSIVAQTVAARNGSRTQSDPVISRRRQMMARVVRVRS